ncbi:MAG: response regulator [Methylacidiphilales bacterium]|nr:response regulator [Candidatus Methylacidiphilales bacterium]
MIKEILLVEDNKELAKVLEFVLCSKGYKITTLPDGLSALAHLKQAGTACCQLILTDFKMPGANGLELINQARALGYTGKAILISGHLTEGTDPRVLRQAFAEVLQKPFTMEQLISCIESLAS